MLPSRDFKSLASTNSATRARAVEVVRGEGVNGGVAGRRLPANPPGANAARQGKSTRCGMSSAWRGWRRAGHRSLPCGWRRVGVGNRSMPWDWRRGKLRESGLRSALCVLHSDRRRRPPRANPPGISYSGIEKTWRLSPESNRGSRLCRPLHNHSATQPIAQSGGYPAAIRRSSGGQPTVSGSANHTTIPPPGAAPRRVKLMWRAADFRQNQPMCYIPRTVSQPTTRARGGCHDRHRNRAQRSAAV